MRTSNFLAAALMATAAVTVAQAAEIDQARVRTAVEKGVAKALEGGPSFVKVSGCISCHNNTLPVMAASLAHSRGAAVDQKAEEQQMKTIAAVVSGFREPLLEASYAVPDTQVSIPYVLLAYHAERAPADDLNAAAIHAIASRQLRDGSWPSYINRAPIENGDIQATALSVRAMQIYGMPGRSAEWNRRIGNARDWLVTATAKTTEDKAMLVSGLHWCGASEEQIARAARNLLNDQRPDGG
jgi:N-acyl-D-amino-acid deacylase